MQSRTFSLASRFRVRGVPDILRRGLCYQAEEVSSHLQCVYAIRFKSIDRRNGKKGKLDVHLGSTLEWFARIPPHLLIFSLLTRAH